MRRFMKTELSGRGQVQTMARLAAAIVAVALFTLVIIWPSGVSSHVRGALLVVAGALSLLVAARQMRHGRHGKE
jgi:fatty acid desaturase